MAGVTFNAIPGSAQTNSAVKVVRATGGRVLTYKSLTPNTCAAGAKYVLVFEPGVCRVNVYAGSRLIKRIRVVSSPNATAAGPRVDHVRLLFNGDASKITKVSIAEMNFYAPYFRKSPLVITHGHTANDGGPIGSAWSTHLSMRRAQKVAAFIEKLGAPKTMAYWFGNTQLASLSKKSENRRVDVAWIAD